MDSLLKRILKVADNEGVKITSLESILGASKGVLSRALSNNTDINSKWVSLLVEKYPRYNAEWLLTGKGSMLKGESAQAIGTGIPLVTIRAVGGFGNSNFAIGERDVKDYYVIPKFKHKQIDFMIEVEGSSMYPKYNSGDVVACRIIKESGFVQWNKTHVIATKEQGILIKRIRLGKDDSTLLMVSDNKDYPEFEVPKKEIDGIALVVGVIRLE